MGKLTLYFLTLTLLALGSASRCPEPRKPHPTSCSIFYNCINLPGGGYVWAPAKCSNNLVYQPYLRICVLPGDSWTCDILATEPPETTTTQIPDLIDSTQTSYLGYGEEDYYNNAEKYTEPEDNQQQTVTPYPLIEATQSSNNYVNQQIDSTIKNLGLPIAIKHSEDNYLYHFVNGQQVLATPANANGEQLQAHLRYLTQLLERLTVLQGLGIPLDRQPQTTPMPSTTENNYNNYNDFPTKKEDSAIKFLIRDYILKSQAESTKTLELNDDQEVITTTAKTIPTTDYLSLEFTGQGGNNIVMVKDSLSNQQYFTVSKYKKIADQLTTQTVEVIPCTIGIRHPNSTDCTKYYSCEPETAIIRQFSCPSNTAFNKYKRLCERNAYTVCVAEIESTSKSYLTTNVARNGESTIQSMNTSPCQTIGKHMDPASETHYYLCYSNGGKTEDLKFQRMACPNNLLFCEGKNVCTTRKRCYAA